MARSMDAINDETGFANGDKFDNERQVRKYFTAENMREMFGSDGQTDQATLDLYAEVVIEEKWHCDF